MKYKIRIDGMHCQGCGNLIKMTLEDEGFEKVTVSVEKETGSFVSQTGEAGQVKAKLDEAFAGLSGYSYNKLEQAK